MIAPIDFIKEKYIKPNKLTQDILCEKLHIGKKTMSELYQHKRSFTIHTAKKFAKFFNIKPEFILMKQLEYDLSKDDNSYKDIKPYEDIKQEDIKLNNAKWILSSINNSISNKSQHYTIDDIYNIFDITNFNDKENHYAILTIFKEVDSDDIIKYCELNNISRENLKELYLFYKRNFNGKEVRKYEWLLK